MSSTTTLDRLVDISNYTFKYSGHDDWETIQISSDSPLTRCLSRLNGASFEKCAGWIQKPIAAGTPAQLKLLVITTFHPTSSKSLSHKPEEPKGPKATERENQISAVKKLFADTKLPMAGFAAYVKTLLSFAQVPPISLVDQRNRACYYYSSPPWGLTWSYCTTTGHTQAVLFCRDTVKKRLMGYLENALESLKRFVNHPMVLAYLTVEISLAELCSVLLETSNEILGLEKNTGLSAWDWVNEQEIPGSHIPSNYEYTSKRLSMLSGKVTHIRFRLRTLKEYTQSILRIARKHQSTVTDPTANRQCEEIEETLVIVSEYMEVRLHKADSLQERLDNQVSGMSNIISQRDTSAMKTIAIVTMVFLPGTFVASFFSMPMLNWNAAAYDQIFSHRFWIYWTVTVPLTISVFALWWARQQVKKWNETKADKEYAKLRQYGVEAIDEPNGALIV